MRSPGALNKKLSKNRLLSLSTETLALAMVEFLSKLKTENLSFEQKQHLQKIYTNFLLIEESR